jgi:hypothetical protein
MMKNVKISPYSSMDEIKQYVLQKIPLPNNIQDIDSISYILLNDIIIEPFTTINEIPNFLEDKLLLIINTDLNTKSKETEIEIEGLCPIELLPKLNRTGYKTEPSMIELTRMTTEELK